MAFAKPLRWPLGWARTDYPIPPRFKASTSRTVDELETVLDQLGAVDVVITTNQDTRLDGGLRTAVAYIPLDTGVAVYFKRHNKEVCIPCDKFSTVYGNLRAIGLTLEYIRRMERYGTSEMVDAAFTGFTALPANVIVTPYTARMWYEVLQVSPTADWDVVEAAYKRLLNKTHPDKGGTTEAFMGVQAAFRQAKEARHG